MEKSNTLQKAIEVAEWHARNKGLEELKAHHLLYALASFDNEARGYMTAYGLNIGNLERIESGRGGRKILTYSDEVETIIFRSENYARSMNAKENNCVYLLLAILTLKGTYAYGKIDYIFNHDKKMSNAFFRSIVDDLPNPDQFLQFVTAPDYALVSVDGEKRIQAKTSASGDTAPKKKTSGDIKVKESDESSVAENVSETIPYGADLTELAREGKLDPVIGRELETERVIQTLTRRSKNNPVLVGEAGVGKTAVVEGFANAISQGRVPRELQNKRLVELDIASILAGTRYRGDFEERLTRIINRVIAQKNVILFIDEIHNLVGAGATAEGAMGASEILKPMLARGELQIIGATTTKEYRQYIERDPALERRFQPITVEEPSPEVAIEILKGVRHKYEKHHKVEIGDAAIEEAVNLSVRYVTDRRLPDKAFDIIDEACSKLKITAYAVPPRLVQLANELKTLKQQKDAVPLSKQNTPEYKELCEKYHDKYYEYEYIQSDYDMQLDDYKCKLTENDVRKVVSQMTGVPVQELSVAERDKLVHLEEELSKRVIGQDEAVKAVARAVRRQRAGLKDPNRPIGSFIFVGPTGVGKTELAKALSQCLFGSNTDVIRIDMSEYMDKQSTAKLIGAPPGYVGYDEGGYLTDRVQSKPYSVVLFDEIEKAHPDIFNLLLQILDEGRLTDSRGKTVDFRNTVIIMTSNVGVTDGAQNGIGFGHRDGLASMKRDIESSLRKTFRPEFLNRLDEIIVFDYLSQEETFKITKMLCYGLYARLQKTLTLRFTDRAIRHISSEGYDKSYGARPLKRAIQRQIEDPLAEKLLRGEIKRGDVVSVDAENGAIVFRKRGKE